MLVNETNINKVEVFSKILNLGDNNKPKLLKE